MSLNKQQENSPTSLLFKVWYQLVDSPNGLPYKGRSFDAVSLPPGSFLIHFRDAVHRKNSSIMTDIDPSELVVYRNKAAFAKRNTADDGGKEGPLEEDALVDGLGKDEEDVLVVVVPATVTSTASGLSLADKLRNLGVEFSDRELNYTLINETAYYSLLMDPYLTAYEAERILIIVKSRIKTETSKDIALQHSFHLNGLLKVGDGQDKSSFYYALSEEGGIVVAKVYNGHKDAFIREVETSRALDHENLVKFIKSFSIQNDLRHIIIMPFFPRSVSDWLTHHPALPLTAIKVIARNCFDALCHMHSKGFCFVDLKPSNIMLQNGEQGHATLVDYGATVRTGSPIIEFTEQYCLDANTCKATEHLDWICLGTTIAQMRGFPIDNFDRAVDLVDEVCLSSEEERLKKLIVSCLQSPSLSKIESALNQL